MASVIKRGRTWAYVVELGRDPVTGKRRQKWVSGFDSRESAEAALAEAKDHNTGNRGKRGYRTWVAPSHQTLKEYMGRWLAAMRLSLRPTTANSYEDCIRGHVVSRIGDLKMFEITPPAG